MDLQIPVKRAKLEKLFSTGWFDLPFEMREMIMKKMNFKSRCVFAQCSKWCAEEVKKVEKLMFNIALARSTDDSKHPKLCVGDESCEYDEIEFLYYMEFVEIRNCDVPKTEVIYFKACKNDNGIEKWRRMENGKAEDVRMQYFDDFIDSNYERVYKIDITDKYFPACKYDMRKLKNIGKIEDMSRSDLLKSEVFDISQLNYADDVASPHTNVTFEQVINLKGRCYELKSDDFDEEKVARLFEMFKEGEMDFNINILELHIDLDSRPDIETITEDLDLTFSRGSSFGFDSEIPKSRYAECTLTQNFLRIYIE